MALVLPPSAEGLGLGEAWLSRGAGLGGIPLTGTQKLLNQFAEERPQTALFQHPVSDLAPHAMTVQLFCRFFI